MNNELKSLLQNKADGEAQVASRKAHIATLTDSEEIAAHRAALAREEAGLASILSRIDELTEALDKPEPKPKPKH